MRIPGCLSGVAAASMLGGGGDGGGGVGTAPVPVSGLPSAGGVWATPVGDGPGTLYIAENGQLQYTGSSFGTVSQGFEGTTFSGFVQRFDEALASSTNAPGSLYLLLTGTVQGRLTQISVFYRRT